MNAEALTVEDISKLIECYEESIECPHNTEGSTDMQKDRKQEINTTLKDSQERYLAGEVKMYSLERFEDRLKEKRKRPRKLSQALKVMSEISMYLKSRNIFFEECREEDAPHITMVFKNCDRCPGRFTEGSIYFYDDCLEARVYYSEVGTKWCKESKGLSELYRLMNYLNAKVWPCVKDGMDGTLYRSEHLITPRFCVTEDGCQDITTIMAIPYSHFELDVLEMEDFITAALPDLLDSLSAPIFLLLLGEINIEKAISLVDTEILGKGGKE